MLKNSLDFLTTCRNHKFPTLQEQENLVEKKLASKKVSHCGKYVMFKYTRRAMYDKLWFTHPELMECRGHVYNIASGDIVVMAPRKSFNYTENAWWSEVGDDEYVYVTKKYNGFLCNRTVLENDILVTTTGSFDSDFVNLAKYSILDAPKNILFHEPDPNPITASYEVIHSSDPHIVDEGRNRIEILTYRMQHGDNVPFNLRGMTFGEAKELAKTDTGEGFMVYHCDDYKMLSPCKLKTDTYVGRKSIMRASANSLQNMYKNPENWCKIRHLNQKYTKIAINITICYSFDLFNSMSDQERRVIIEEMEKQ